MFTCGEAISAAVMSQALKRAGIPAIGLTSAQARIFTDGHHVEADIERGGDQPPALPDGGRRRAGRDRRPGRGARGRSTSRRSAAAAAIRRASRSAWRCTRTAWTSSPTSKASPASTRGSSPARASCSASATRRCTQLARFGAKVVHPRALKAGWAGGTPIAVRSTFTDAPGTLVSDVDDERPLVGVAQPAGDAHARPACRLRGRRTARRMGAAPADHERDRRAQRPVAGGSGSRQAAGAACARSTRPDSRRFEANRPAAG